MTDFTTRTTRIYAAGLDMCGRQKIPDLSISYNHGGSCLASQGGLCMATKDTGFQCMI
jgi:hypothetical protein